MDIIKDEITMTVNSEYLKSNKDVFEKEINDQNFGSIK